MNDEFAIDPTAFENALQFQYVLEKFGFHQGRFIVGLPSKWAKQVHEHIVTFPDLEQARIKRILEKKKQIIFKPGGLGFDPQLEWAENVNRASNLTSFQGVLAAKPNRFSYPTLQEIDDSFFGASFDVRVEGTADNYSTVAKRLLQSSHEIVIVDPYLRLNRPACEVVIKHFLNAAQQNGSAKHFVFWTREDKANIKGYKRLLEERYKSYLSPKSTLKVRLVDDSHSIEKMHARLLLSSLGGLRFDHGFEHFDDGRRVDISLITQQAHDAHCKWYLDVNPTNDFNIIEEHVIESS